LFVLAGEALERPDPEALQIEAGTSF